MTRSAFPSESMSAMASALPNASPAIRPETAPIFVGGLVRWWVERKSGETSDSDLSAGTLFSSGLIAGGSLAGILYAILFGYQYAAPTTANPNATSSLYADYFAPIGDLVPSLHGDSTGAQVAGALLFLALAVILSRFARRTI